MEKFTYDFVVNYYKNHNCTLLESTYHGVNQLMRYKYDKCGHDDICKFAYFKAVKRHKCKQCHKTSRYEYAKKCFANHGYILLEPTYNNTTVSMQYQCHCGNISKISLSNLEKDDKCMGCIKCAGREKYTIDYVREFFKKHDCELLSTEYINSKTPLQFRCQCGNIGRINFNNFHRPSRHKCCRECWKKTFSKEKHYNWNPDRQFLKLKQSFHRRCCTLLWNALQQTGMKKTAKTKEMLGYTTEELRIHLMNHPNWEFCRNKKWDIDHVFPVSAFFREGILDHKIINSLDNLQPLPKVENLSKADKYDHNKFIDWLAQKGIYIKGKNVAANS